MYDGEAGSGIMIENDRQYRITRTQAERFERSLEELQRSRQDDEDLHPRLSKAREDAIRSQLVDLKDELDTLAAMSDDDIDTSDIPEITDFANARRGVFSETANRIVSADDDDR